MAKQVLGPEEQEDFNRLAEQYASLKIAYDSMEERFKAILSRQRDALDDLREKMTPYMDMVRDNETDTCRVRTPSGTFFTQWVMNFSVSDPDAVRRQVLEGTLPPNIYEGNVSRKAMQNEMERRMTEGGYYDLPAEQKLVKDFAEYAPDGVLVRPFERLQFRRSRS